MELLFQDEKIYYNQPDVVQIIEKIKNWLGESYYYSHLIVDNINVYEEPELYLSMNLGHIQKLEVVAQTAQEFKNDVLLTAEVYLNNALPEISVLADSFYNTPSTDQWLKFNDLIEGIQWVNQFISTLNLMKEKPLNWEEYLKFRASLEIELRNLVEALENTDYILIADIIQYELLPLYEELLKEIISTIDTEGTRFDVN